MENNNINKHNLTASSFFLLLGRIISLIAAFISGLSILFQGINRLIPNTTSSYYGISNQLQTAISFFFVSIIVLFILEIIDKKNITKNNDLLLLPLRKWFLIAVLFILGLVILGDAIAIIQYFLSGEITARFISKVLSLLMLSSIVFIYYYHVLTWNTVWSFKSRKVFSILGIVVSVGILIFGFYLTGSPKTQRNIRMDQEKENTLQSINYSIIDYYQKFGSLPKNINDLNRLPYGIFTEKNNRQDLNSYDYKLIDSKKNKYELCTKFNLSTETIEKYMDPVNGGNSYISRSVSSPEDGIYNETDWTHNSGLYCFTRQIDSKIYPVNTESNK